MAEAVPMTDPWLPFSRALARVAPRAFVMFRGYSLQVNLIHLYDLWPDPCKCLCWRCIRRGLKIWWYGHSSYRYGCVCVRARWGSCFCCVISVAGGQRFGVWDSASVIAVFFRCVRMSVLTEVLFLRVCYCSRRTNDSVVASTPGVWATMLQSAKCGATVVLADICVQCAVTFIICGRDGRESNVWDRLWIPFKLSVVIVSGFFWNRGGYSTAIVIRRNIHLHKIFSVSNSTTVEPFQMSYTIMIFRESIC
jgi:hypothetical protein